MGETTFGDNLLEITTPTIINKTLQRFPHVSHGNPNQRTFSLLHFSMCLHLLKLLPSRMLAVFCILAILSPPTTSPPPAASQPPQMQAPSCSNTVSTSRTSILTALVVATISSCVEAPSPMFVSRIAL